MDPLGHSITGSPHSVCVSLPTLRDVIGYEEKDPRVLNSLSSGYPRFFRNPIIRTLEEYFISENLLQMEECLLPDSKVAEDLARFPGMPGGGRIRPVGPFWTLSANQHPNFSKAQQAFLTHTGNRISSREAERVLVQMGLASAFPEEREEHQPYEKIQAALQEVYGTASPADIFLFRSGMNAFYAGFRTLHAHQLHRQRDIWIQVGWLYVDTVRLLEKFAPADREAPKFIRVHDLQSLEDFLKEFGHRVAGIVTEVPTNPLVETCDLDFLRDRANRYKAALILDPSLVSPHNVHVLPYCDLHINSLTKYAAADADVMMGAAALNPNSRFYDDLRQGLCQFGSPPGLEDAARLAFQIPRYAENIHRMNVTLLAVVEYLEHHPAVDRVFWARQQGSEYNFNWIQHREAGPGCVLSFTLHKGFERFYDACPIAKTPSFGARFSMMCPFLYLAHYDLVSTASGRQHLHKNGLSPELIRLSVGLEPVEEILQKFEIGFSAISL